MSLPGEYETGSPEPVGEGRSLRAVLDKLQCYRESLDTIECWIDGNEPAGLALGVRPPDFGDASRAALTMESLDEVIRHEHH